MARRFPLIRRATIWAALVITIAVLSIVLWPTELPDDLISLSGPRLVRVEHQGQQLGVKELYFPGQLSHSGVPFGATVRARWNIQLPEDAPPWGVWIERPEYASRTLWDGELVSQTGQIDGVERSEQPVLAFLPPTPGKTDHTLELQLQGAFGRGGVVGRIVHGPLVEINRAAWRVEAQRVALMIILGSLAILQLVIASRQRWRPVNAFFGLFCICAASYIFLRSDMGATWLHDALLSIRLRRVATAWIGPAAVAFVVTFSRPRLPRWAAGLLAVSALASVVALTIPNDLLPTLEIALDVGLIGCCVVFLVVVLPISAKHRHGGTLLAAATLVPLVFGVLSEVLVTNGVGSGGSHLFPTLLTFTVGATAAIMVRDIAVSERHHNLVESSVDAIITVDRTGSITDANPAAVTLFEREPVGSPLLDWVMHDDQPIVRAHFMPSAHRSDRAEFRFRGQRDLVVESVGTALERGDMLLVLRDVTRRRKLDQGLLQAARMETVAVLVGGIAHDFNNMLGTLLAHVGFLQMFSGTQPRIKKRLERMETTIERASLLTRRLLALSGGATASLTTTDLRAVMLSSAELVEPTLPDGVTMHIDVPTDLLHIAASPADLEHVLVNLLVNARDAIGRHGTIRFAARPFRTDGHIEGVICLIEDDGPGVPVELRAKIFEPFFSTKGPKRGTGLGLAVATQIVREHNGRIWVEDRPGGGSRFCMALHSAEALYEESAPLPDGRKILLVEDEEVLRENYSTALTKAGYQVQSRADGESAAQYLQANRPDLLVTDVIMPGMTGIDLAGVCRALHPDTPILLVSGFIPEDVFEQGDSMLHRLDKPVRSSRLVAVAGRIRRATERSMRGADDITESIVHFPSLDDISYHSADWSSERPATSEEAAPDE